MASPDVFLSSPARGTHRATILVDSSPDLPPIQDLVSQVRSRPPIKSGSKSQPIPEGVSTTFTSAKEHWKLAQAAAENHDTSDSVIEVPPEPIRKPRKPRKRKETAASKNEEQHATTPKSPIKDQPWKKYKASPEPKGLPAEAEENEVHTTLGNAGGGSKKPAKKTGAMSKHFQERPAEARPQTTVTKEADEPLHLEPATRRRADWTPPPPDKKVAVEPPSDILPTQDVESSVPNVENADMFKNLLENYGCNEQLPSEVVAISDEDSSFLKKRKLVEFVNTNDTSRSVSPVVEKPAAKPKAPRKKPRTITALATAAYRTPTQPEPTASTASAVDCSTKDSEGGEAHGSDSKGKGKANARKKQPKKSKRKPPPPKPTLLSPSTALKEVSKQDFVFGTSSQLVREQSPTLLRDIQAAIKQSAQLERESADLLLNSDTIDPPERRPKLWHAGARDADGDLFDVEIIDLVGGPEQELPTKAEANPFGYSKAETNPGDNSFETLSDILPSPVKPTSKSVESLPDIQAQNEYPVGIDSFETLSDLLPSPVKKQSDVVDDDSPFASSQISVSTDIQKPNDPPPSNQQELCERDRNLVVENGSASRETPRVNQPKRPNFELYTDAQLSKEITAYGFKSVKRRSAMLALIDQCWQSKNQIGQASVRMLTTSTNPLCRPHGDSTAPVEPVISPKRPRGRPRKNSTELSPTPKLPLSSQGTESPKRRGRPRKDSTSALKTSPIQASEPPPSAQLLESPKRPRGRPRKESESPLRKSPKISVAAGKKGSRSKTVVPPRPSTPTRKPAIPRTVIEIPDSASENGSDMSASPTSSPEQTFSPPAGVDLSISMEEDTEMSLTITPDDNQTALFDLITKAVTSAPRSTDPMNPSWYEKMLLYDPIVLEDLTSWLNSGQLTSVGHDGEVSAVEVKKWCESKSVCCLWRVNLRGKERKRY